MDAAEYINLQAQIDRQTPEQQEYYDLAAVYTTQAEMLQPEVDAAQVAVDEAQIAMDAAQLALNEAIKTGQDTTPYVEALTAAEADFQAAQSNFTALTTEQSNYITKAQETTTLGDTIGAAIAECQALIDAEPPPTPAQQAAARAEWLAYLLFLRREAVANAVQQVPVLVADLPIALVHAGLRAFVLDATKDKFGDVVVGGGPNKVPVYSDGLVWRIG